MTASTHHSGPRESMRGREALLREAARIARQWELTRPSLSTSFPTFVIAPYDLGTSPRLVHAGWEAILFDGETPVAVLSASKGRTRQFGFSGVTAGDWPERLTAAVAAAEETGLLRDRRFAVVSAPHAGLVFVWNRVDSFLPIVSRAGLHALHAYSIGDIAGALGHLRRRAHR